MLFSHYLLAITLSGLMAIFLNSCSESTNPDDTTETAGQRVALQSGQGPDNGMILIDSIVATQAGWVVVHRDNGSNGPTIPAIIGKHLFDSGTTTDLQLQLDSAISDGEKLWAMLHTDDGIVGTYEFNGTGTPDQPIVEDGLIVMVSFTISQTDPDLELDAQLPTDNTIVIRKAASPENGWFVIHANENSAPGRVITEVPVEKGVHTNLTLTMPTDSGSLMSAGDTLWGMLHYDRGVEGTYEFPGADLPARYSDGRIVLVPFTIAPPEALSIQVSDQEVIDNHILVDRVMASGPGWITVQRDNGKGGPISSAGIGVAQVFAGENTKVSITLSQSISKGGGLWIVLHQDDGARGVFEYPDFDLPILVEGKKVATSFTIE